MKVKAIEKWVTVGRKAAYLFFFCGGIAGLLTYVSVEQWHAAMVCVLALASAFLAFYCFRRAALIDHQIRGGDGDDW